MHLKYFDRLKNDKSFKKKMEVFRNASRSLSVYNFLYGRYYAVKNNPSDNCLVAVLKLNEYSSSQLKKFNNNPPPGTPRRGDWLVRFDKPHDTTNYDHINLNPRLNSRFREDPHLKVPPLFNNSVFRFSQVGKFIYSSNLYVSPIGMVFDLKDNSFTQYGVISCAAKVGDCIGSLIFPGVGTIIGAMVGALVGGLGGNVVHFESLMPLFKASFNASLQL